MNQRRHQWGGVDVFQLGVVVGVGCGGAEEEGGFGFGCATLDPVAGASEDGHRGV